jgi:hypothetical protein
MTMDITRKIHQQAQKIGSFWVQVNDNAATHSCVGARFAAKQGATILQLCSASPCPVDTHER